MPPREVLAALCWVAGGGRGCARRLARELASPFLAKPIQMSFAGLGNPPPARRPVQATAPWSVGI